jgi:predicted AlkP superfamily phosphohydrolase/phosphomutase
MRSFALPAFADGHVRINVRGRDPAGIVDAAEYDAECDRVTEFLKQVRHGRTGRPLIGDVLRIRRSATDEDKRLPHADLVAIFADDPVDVVDSPHVGRIGPVPFYRTGGHSQHGFVVAAGPGIKPGCILSNTDAVDLGPTILEMMGTAVPDHFDGRSWLAAVMA